MALRAVALAAVFAAASAVDARDIDPTVHGRYQVGFTRMTFTTTSVTSGEPRSPIR